MQTISQILQNALASSTKTASAATPTVVSTPDIADLVFAPKKEAAATPPPAPEKKASTESSMSLAAHGMKLARALSTAADLVKEAGLTVTATPTGGTMSVPAASNNSVPAKYEAGKAPGLDGAAVQTSENDPVSSLGPPSGKSASLRLANAKIADAAVLERYGQKEAAEVLRKEASTLQKRAEMEDGPSASGDPAMPTTAASMTGGGEGPALSNEKMINITRAEARNPTTNEMRKVISETPKVDPVTKAVVGSSEGVKASQAEFLREYIKKAHAVVADSNATEAQRKQAAAVLGSFAQTGS